MELPRYQDLISRFANNHNPPPEVTRAKEIEMMDGFKQWKRKIKNEH